MSNDPYVDGHPEDEHPDLLADEMEDVRESEEATFWFIHMDYEDDPEIQQAMSEAGLYG